MHSQASDHNDRGGAVTGFLSASLFVLAGCAVLGTIPPSILAAKTRKPVVAVLAILIAAFVVYVLVATATKLHQS
jgi:hypothetical protein